jgi:CheY-like chemotaxis protein
VTDVVAAPRVVRVLIADDNVEVRSLVREILSAHPDLDVVADAANGADALVSITGAESSRSRYDSLTPTLLAVKHGSGVVGPDQASS